MNVSDALVFVESRSKGVLATHRSNGRPQMSNIVYGTDGGSVLVSITADRAKTANMRRDPRASLHVSADDFWSWVVLDCEVALGPVAAQPGDQAVLALRALYRSISGEHPDWDDYDRAMIADRRLVATLHPVHAYGQGV